MTGKRLNASVASAGTSLTHVAYNAIRDEILACRLEPGAKLIIADLAQEMGFGLSSVREALSRLTSEGLVLAEPQRGFRVAPTSYADLKDLTELRVGIEGQAIYRSVKLGDIAWEGRVLASFHELARTPERDGDAVNPDWIKAHSRFHETLVAACDSPWLLRVRELLFIHSERYRILSINMDRPQLEQEHRAIAEAAVARDAERAAALLGEHIKLTATIILSTRGTGEKLIA